MAGFPRPHLFKVVVTALICCLAGFAFCARGYSAPAPTQEAINLSAPEKQELVRQAVAYYEQGEHDKAQKGLEQARTVFPENYAVPYYLGLIYLEQGQRSEAIAQWQQYVKMDPESENALKIRKNLTVLLRQQARQFAKQAVADEAALVGGQADDSTVAVTSFSNLGSENLGPLGKGMAAMLISDLSKVPDLKVVDRIQLQALLEEMKLGTSGLVDSKTAPKVGKLLKAGHVTSGSLADPDKDRLMIASAVVNTDKSAAISSQEAQGMLKQFYDLEKQIACQIIADLGRDCEKVPGGFYIIHTKSMPALVLYSRGLDEFDRQNYDEAREMFQKALDEDPRFDLAAEALLATPAAAMLLMNASQMISDASAGAPSSATAGSAVAGTSASASTVAASTAAGTVGFSPTTMIIAGVAVAGGGAALAGGGGGGGESSSTQPASVTDLTGEWRGTWTDNANGSSSAAVFTLVQTGTSVSGTVSLTDEQCLSQGDVNGTVSGKSANLTVTSDAEVVALNAAIDSSAKTLTGTWNYTGSARENCAGGTGTFSATMPGGADIHW